MAQSRSLVCCLAYLVALTCGACAEEAPDVPETFPVRDLAPADARIDGDFTLITSVRELADGRVLISDEGGDAIYFGDFQSGEVRKIGRSGTGPGEYREVNRLWALDGDTTIMVDGRADRWLVLHGAEIVATIPTQDPAVAAVWNKATPDGFDHRGGVVFRVLRKDETGRPIFKDPSFIVRYDRLTETLDTISMTSEEPPLDMSPPRYWGQHHVGIVTRDQVAVMPDGRVAIARGDPYRLDWCVPRGECSAGPALGVAAEFTDNAKRDYLAAMAIIHPERSASVDNYARWPLDIPPFAIPNNGRDESVLHPTADGDFLIERLTVSDRLIREHDIIDRRGTRIGRMELSLQQRIIGFGANHAYVVTTDELDVPHLSRHPWR